MSESESNQMRQALMEASESLAPIREWLAGERAYFLRQGYTEDEARAMSAAVFVSLFGQTIPKEQQ